MSAPPVLVFDGVVKRYGDVLALAGLDLEVRPGRLVCLAGANGAGKTTALDILMGLRRPSAGDVRIGGVSVASPEIHEKRRRIGYMAEEPALYPALTPREYLDFMAELYGVAPAARSATPELLDSLGLSRYADRRIDGLSMGNRRKVAFAAAMLPDPDVLVLDEPTNGMDVAAARAAKDHLRRARDRGRVVLFTTHVMELAEALADEVVVLHAGRRVAHGTPAELGAEHGRHGASSLEDVILEVSRGGADPLATAGEDVP